MGSPVHLCHEPSYRSLTSGSAPPSTGRKHRSMLADTPIVLLLCPLLLFSTRQMALALSLIVLLPNSNLLQVTPECPLEECDSFILLHSCHFLNPCSSSLLGSPQPQLFPLCTSHLTLCQKKNRLWLLLTCSLEPPLLSLCFKVFQNFTSVLFPGYSSRENRLL